MNPVRRKLLRIELTDAIEAEEMFVRLMGDEVDPAASSLRITRSTCAISMFKPSLTLPITRTMPDEIEPTTPTPEPSPQPDGGAYSRGEKISKINVADEIKNSLPRLFDVRSHLARAARCARRPEDLAAPHSLRDARVVAVPGPQALQMREDLR